MSFSNGDRTAIGRIEEHLGRIGGQIIDRLDTIISDLAALKQQAADQQHAIDQARRDANAAINANLTEIRATVRDGLDRSRDDNGDTLTRIGSDLGHIREALDQLDGQVAATPSDRELEPLPVPADESHMPAAPPQLAPAPGPADETPDTEPEAASPDPVILRAAAGISRATLHAHRDTWAFLVEHAGSERHFHIPGKVKDSGGFARARVSGPSLVAAITTMNRVTRDPDDNTAAIAAHIHGKITGAVQEVIDRPHSGSGAKRIHIVIDDRAAPEEDDGQPDTLQAEES
ncbi:hypothetical protein [Streptomyces sp. NPDC059786]|uniref:hypothetical protein n=1 Tax=Streptomyces sp. NPDC059786 TaxID=3346946 RepID=UPI0036555171